MIQLLYIDIGMTGINKIPNKNDNDNDNCSLIALIKSIIKQIVRKYDATAFNDISDVNGKLLVWLVLLIQLI